MSSGMTTFTCDGCSTESNGARVVFTTEATDATGLDVTVTKRWTTCPGCASKPTLRPTGWPWS